MSVSLEGMTAEQIADLASLAKAQLDNPKTRQHFLRNSKVVNPDVSIPEVDIPLQMQGLFAESKKTIEGQAAEIASMRMERDIERRRDNLMSKHGLSKKDVEEVEKMMLEKQIASHDTAAEFYLSQQKSAAPTPSMFSTNSLPKIDLKTAGFANMGQWSRSEAGRVIDELRGRVRAA